VAIELALRNRNQNCVFGKTHVELVDAILQAAAIITSAVLPHGHGTLEGLVAGSRAHGNLRRAHLLLTVAVVVAGVGVVFVPAVHVPLTIIIAR
jgi:hypothetical protein